MDNNDKNFLGWMDTKSRLHTIGGTHNVKNGEIWWCGVGENVGVEINGKGRTFARPVLVYKKYSKFGFLGLPLTSQAHEGSWYAHFTFKKKEQFVALTQMRMFSTSRLYNKMGELPLNDFRIVDEALRRLLFE